MAWQMESIFFFSFSEALPPVLARKVSQQEERKSIPSPQWRARSLCVSKGWILLCTKGEREEECVRV